MIKVFLHEVLWGFLFNGPDSNFITQGEYLVRLRPRGYVNGSQVGISLYKREETAPQSTLALEYHGSNQDIKDLIAKIGTRKSALDPSGAYYIRFPEVEEFMRLGETHNILLLITPLED
ncbi:MAG: hypothetical protein UZ21_OP11001000350 [Microgenomates bacterium OLB22]|nr:MAG: hypothetical protein UZ21_OP11001000350 [Microgenomates bacterium OLB22]